MKNFLIVFFGAGLGGALRYSIGNVVKWNGLSLPWSTLIVNVLGCLIIGIVASISIKNEIFLQQYQLVLATGFCGGFTTFSALGLESMQLIKQGNYTMVVIYILLSILMGIGACITGFLLAK